MTLRPHPRRRSLHSRDARSLWLARLPRSVQRGPCSLRRTLGDRPAAAGRDAGLRPDAHSHDRGLGAETGATPPFDLLLAPLYAVCSTRERYSDRCRCAAQRVPERPPTIHRIVDLSALSPHSDALSVRVAERNSIAVRQIAPLRTLSQFLAWPERRWRRRGGSDVSVRVLHFSQLLTGFPAFQAHGSSSSRRLIGYRRPCARARPSDRHRVRRR